MISIANLRLSDRAAVVKAAALAATLALAGCGGGEHQEIQKWMADATSERLQQFLSNRLK